MQLFGSERYVREKLEGLSAQQMCKLKETFLRNTHPRFKREFAASRHQPFGKTSDYIKCIQNVDIPKIAKLVRLFGLLMQTKTCLFGDANKRPTRFSSLALFQSFDVRFQ